MCLKKKKIVWNTIFVNEQFRTVNPQFIIFNPNFQPISEIKSQLIFKPNPIPVSEINSQLLAYIKYKT